MSADASSSVATSAAELAMKAEVVLETTASAVGEAVSQVAHAAEEFVEEMTGVEGSRSASSTPEEEEEGSKGEGSSLTLEARRAKLEQLRKRMVSFVILKFCSVLTHLPGCFFKSEPRLACGRIIQGQDQRPGSSSSGTTEKACRNTPNQG